MSSTINFSVIIPTHNRPNLLARALESVLKNLQPDDEVIVIDDGSELNYEHVLDKFRDERIHYHKIPNGGVSVARNHGLEVAKNPFVAFLDDDDEWYANHLSLHRSVYASLPGIAGVFCDFDYTTKSGEKHSGGVSIWSAGKKPIQELLKPQALGDSPQPVAVYTGYHYVNQLTTDYILPSSFSFNREVCGRQDRFLVGLHRNQTWLFNSHVCSYGDVAYVDAVTCIQHADAAIRNTGIGSFRTLLSRLTVMKVEWGRNEAFLRQHGRLFRDTQFSDFYYAMRIALKEMSPAKVFTLLRLVGPAVALRYTPLTLLYLFTPGKVQRRTT